MLHKLLLLTKKCVNKQYLHVTIPIFFGIVILLFGTCNLPHVSEESVITQPPRLRINIESEDRRTLQYIADSYKIFITRISDFQYLILFDLFGILDFSTIGNNPTVELSSFFSVFCGESEFNCVDEELKRWLSEESKDVFAKVQRYNWLPEIEDEYKFEIKSVKDICFFDYPKNPANSKVLEINQEDNHDHFNPKNGIKLRDSSEINSNQIYLKNQSLGLLIKIESKDSLRGSNNSSGLGINASLTLALSSNLKGGIITRKVTDIDKIVALSNRNYRVKGWRESEDKYRKDFSIRIPENTMPFFGNSTTFIWEDLDNQIKSDRKFLIQGILIGLGITLIVEGFIAGIFTYIENRDSKTVERNSYSLLS